MPRIAILTTNSHFIPFGGAGQFIKGLCQQFLYDEGWVVDLILDQKPKQTKFLMDLKLTGSVYYPQNPLPYSSHRNTYSFSDSINFEKECNLRDALLLALRSNIYDVILINSVEGLSPVYTMGIDKYIKVIFYTHVEFSIGLLDNRKTPFSNRFITYYTNIIKNSENIEFATQSQNNANNIKEIFDINSNISPMFIPESSLLVKSDKKRSGVLFNGRWEPRKRPQEFIDLCKESGLYPKVMTSEKAKHKFEKAFKKAGINDYDIRVGIYGMDKVDFIQSSGLLYHPSHHENFSFSVYEAIASIPVLVDGYHYWHKNFESLGLQLVHSTPKDRSEIAKGLINKDGQDLSKYVENIKDSWRKMLTPLLFNRSEKNIFNKSNHEGSLKDWYNSLGRLASIEDIEMVYKNSSHFKISQLQNGTYISKEKYINKEDNMDNFFVW